MKLRIRPAAVFAGLLIFMAALSDFLSSNPPSAQHLDKFFQPPSRVHFQDNHGKLSLRPFICETELSDSLDIEYREIPSAGYRLEFFFRGYPYRLFHLIPLDIHLVGRAEKPFFYPLGTDDLGRDVCARVLAGTQTSILVLILGICFYSVLGLLIGGLAGLLGGWADSLLMRLSEFVLALPALYLILALRALSPVRTPFWHTLLLTVGIIAAVTWPPMARGVRGLILQLNNSTHIEAARSLGGTPFHIFWRHMLPAMLPFIRMQAVLAAPTFLLGEVVLSFLNVGFRDSGESWGSMLRSLRDVRVVTDFWWNLFPLGMVFLTLFWLNTYSSRVRGREAANTVMRM